MNECLLAEMPSSRKGNIDGGWAYVVALGAFVSFFLMTGFARSFGIMYSAFLDTFRQSDSTTSLLLGVRAACAIVAGPLSTSLSERFTERKVIIVGAFITSLGFSLSFFATSLEFLIGTIGLLVGVGSTLLLGPTFIAIGKYFDKRRSRAITLTSCGGSVGMIVVPILLQKLVDVYTVRGALLVYGGLSLHLIITGAVIRPMVGNEPTVKNPVLKNSDHDTFENIEVNIDAKSSTDSKTAEDHSSELRNSENNGQNLIESKREESKQKIFKTELPQSEEIVVSLEGNKICERTDQEDIGSTVNNVGLRSSECGDCSDTECFIDRHKPTLESQSDSESCRETNERVSQFKKITSDPTLNIKYGFCRRVCQSVLKISQFSILKNPLFILILISGTLAGIPYTCMETYLVPLIESNGISRDSAAVLLSVIGAADIIGRIVCGSLADRKPILPQHVMIVFGIFSGILCSLLFFVKDFNGFLGILIPYGFVCSAQTILIMPTTVKLIGLSELPKAVGVMIFFFGVFGSIAPYLLGVLKDYTGNYRTMFPILGCLNICSSLVLLLEGVVKRRQKRICYQNE